MVTSKVATKRKLNLYGVVFERKFERAVLGEPEYRDSQERDWFIPFIINPRGCIITNTRRHHDILHQIICLKVETAEKNQKGQYPINQFYNQMCRLKYAIFEWEMI